MSKNIPQLFENTCSRFPKNIAIWEHSGENYVGIPYQDLKKSILGFAHGLLSLGVQKGDRVALLSEGRSRWVIAELGAFMCGAICVPLSVKLEDADDILFRISHSGSSFLMISLSQYSKLKLAKAKVPQDLRIILIDSENPNEESLIFSDVLNKGKIYEETHPFELSQRFENLSKEDIATISYTSGTTSDPKGIMLTHGNYLANIEQCSSLFDIHEWFVTLLILPWDHSFAHTVGIYTLFSKGASIACVQHGKTPLETLRNLPKNLKEIRPHFILSVPALAKNFRNNIVNGVEQKGKLAKSLFTFALKIKYVYNGNGLNTGKGWRVALKPLCLLFDKMLFEKVKLAFGGRLLFFVGGAALLDTDLQKFFSAIGVPMYQGFGLTEAAPVISCNSPKNNKMGTSGKIADNMECCICDESGNELPQGQTGEIVVKGKNVMKGYWNNPETTAQTLKYGKLYTGDLGYFDKDGFLNIVGRFKSLLIGNDGEKFSPEAIEEHITEHSKWIQQIMLYNNQSPYTIALLVPHFTKIKTFDHDHSMDNISLEKKIITSIQQEFNVYKNKGAFQGKFPERWLPSTFIILDEPFSESNHMINSTMKMVRPNIVKHYASEIEKAYTPEGKNVFNDLNLNSIQRILEQR